MKKSNIIITTVVGIAVGGWSIASWYVGKQIEDKLPTYTNYIQAELWKKLEPTDLPFKFELVNFKRGFFSTTVQYNILKLPAGYDPFLLNVKIEHGPFPLKSLTNFSLKPKAALIHAELADSPMISQFKSIVTNGITPLTLDIDVYDENNFTFDFNLAPIGLKEKEGSVIINGFKLLGDIRKNTSNSKLEFKISNIDIKNDTTKFELADFKIDTTFTLPNHNILFSYFADKQTLSFARLKVSGLKNISDYPDVNISNLNISSTSRINDKTIDLQSEIRLGDLGIGKFDLGSFNYKVNINNINAKATESLMNAMQMSTMQQMKFHSLTSTVALDDIIRNSFIDILEGNPTLSFSPINWKNAKGELAASFNMDFQAGEPYHPNTYIKSAKFNLNAPRSMLEYGIAQIKSIKENYFTIAVNRNMVNAKNYDAQNTDRNLLAYYQNLKQKFNTNEEAKEQFIENNPLFFAMLLALINIDDTKLTSDVSYEDGTITINGGKPKSFEDFIRNPLD